MKILNPSDKIIARRQNFSNIGVSSLPEPANYSAPTDYIAWYRNDAGELTLSGANITSWNDKSPNNYDLTPPGTSPTYAGNAAVATGNNQYLDATISLAGGAATVCFVAAPTRTVGANNDVDCICSLGTGPATTNLTVQLYNGYASSTQLLFNAQDNSDPYNATIAAYYNGSSVTLNTQVLTKDAFSVFVVTGSGLGSCNKLRVFGYTDTAFGCNGKLKELLLYNRVLTGTEITNISNYLAARQSI